MFVVKTAYHVRDTKEESYHARVSHHSNSKWTGLERGLFKGIDADGSEQYKNCYDFYVNQPCLH